MTGNKRFPKEIAGRLVVVLWPKADALVCIGLGIVRDEFGHDVAAHIDHVWKPCRESVDDLKIAAAEVYDRWPPRKVGFVALEQSRNFFDEDLRRLSA